MRAGGPGCWGQAGGCVVSLPGSRFTIGRELHVVAFPTPESLQFDGIGKYYNCGKAFRSTADLRASGKHAGFPRTGGRPNQVKLLAFSDGTNWRHEEVLQECCHVRENKLVRRQAIFADKSVLGLTLRGPLKRNP